MPKKTIKLEILDTLKVSVVFKTKKDTKEVKLILPEVVKELWRFRSDKEEIAFAAQSSAISNEFISFGMSEEETAKRFKTMIKRYVDAGIIMKKDE